MTILRKMKKLVALVVAAVTCLAMGTTGYATNVEKVIGTETFIEYNLETKTETTFTLPVIDNFNIPPIQRSYTDDWDTATANSDPYSGIVKILSDYKDGSTVYLNLPATGFIVGDGVILTTGHTVYQHDKGGWPTNVKVMFGTNNNGFYQSTYTTAQTMTTTKTFTGSEEKSTNWYLKDYACIRVPTQYTDGRYKFALDTTLYNSSSLSNVNATITGYPRLTDSTTKQVIFNGNIMHTDTNDGAFLHSKYGIGHHIQITSGVSGAPMYYLKNGQYTAFGIQGSGWSNEVDNINIKTSGYAVPIDSTIGSFVASQISRVENNEDGF